MGKQLKLFTTYRCNLYTIEGTFIKTLWETLNKDFAMEFKQTYKTPVGDYADIEEITEDEI